MRFNDAITKLSREVGKTEIDYETKNKIKQSLNFAKIEVGKAAFWDQLHFPNNELILIPRYTTGLCNIINANRVVSIVNGGVVASNWVGRFFASQSSNAEYEIVSVDTSANTITLKSQVIESTSNNLTYYVRKNYYRVPTDILSVMPNDAYIDAPSPFEIKGYDEYAQNYNAGTITLTQDSNVLNGSGTNFLDDPFPVFQGDEIQAGANFYRVRFVNSNTQITMTNKALSPYSGNYIISSPTPNKAIITGRVIINPVNGIVLANDVTTNTILNFGYIRILYAMVHDLDDTELPPAFDRCILDLAKAEFGRITNGQTWQSDLLIAQSRLETLKLNRDLVYHSWTSFRQYVPSRMGRGRGWGMGGLTY